MGVQSTFSSLERNMVWGLVPAAGLQFGSHLRALPALDKTVGNNTQLQLCGETQDKRTAEIFKRAHREHMIYRNKFQILTWTAMVDF